MTVCRILTQLCDNSGGAAIGPPAIRFATIALVIQHRRVAALLLGTWLGASILTDIAVTRNFQTVDRFLDAPGNAGASILIHNFGRDSVRAVLRRNAAEENNWIFTDWERAELVLGSGLFLLLIFSGRVRKMLIAMSIGMTVIVAIQHFVLTPHVIELGRIVDNLPRSDPQAALFWAFHGAYSGLELLKLAAVVFTGALVVIHRTSDSHAIAHHAETIPRTLAAGGRTHRG